MITERCIPELASSLLCVLVGLVRDIDAEEEEDVCMEEDLCSLWSLFSGDDSAEDRAADIDELQLNFLFWAPDILTAEKKPILLWLNVYENYYTNKNFNVHCITYKSQVLIFQVTFITTVIVSKELRIITHAIKVHFKI